VDVQTTASDHILRVGLELGEMTLYRFRFKSVTLARRLARRNLSQNSLAREIGISSGFLSQLLSGARNPGPKTRTRIMAAFPTASFDELFEETEVNG